MEQIRNILRPRRKFIIVCIVVTAVIAGLLSLTQPLKYSAAVRLLITQRATFTLDPYTAIRSSELIAENLAQLTQTSSFFERVLQSGYKINAQYFSGTEQRRRRLWEKTVNADSVRGTGLLKITAYHPDRSEAVKIVSAMSLLLSTQGSEYIGRDLIVRLVDAPLPSRFPVKPNIPLNMLAGGMLGFLLGSGRVWIEHRRKRHHGALI